MKKLDISKLEGKTDLTRNRIKVIIKYIDLFELLYACDFIEQRLIHVLLGVGERTIERYLSEIRKNKYGRELIEETRDGKIIRIHLSSQFYTTVGSGNRFNSKRISKKAFRNSMLRALKHTFYYSNSTREIVDYLVANELEEEVYVTCFRKKHKFIWEEKAYNYIDAATCTGLDNLSVDDKCISVDSVFVCDGTDVFEIIQAYSKVLTLMEYLKYLDFKGCMDKDIKIDFTVVSLNRVKIKEYIYRSQSYTREFDKNKIYHNFSNYNKGSREYFNYYRKTCPDGTKFVLFSREAQSFIDY